MARAATLLWIGLTCAAAAVAGAQPATASGREQASLHFDRGLELVVKGAYPEAVVQFERAYELSGDVAVLHNLGMAYAAADRPVEAASALMRYLEESGAALPNVERTRIEAVIKRQRTQIGYVTVQVEPAGSSIKVDGREAGITPLPSELPLVVGEHRIEASRAGYQSGSWPVSVGSQQHTTLLISLRPTVPAATAATAATAAAAGKTAARAPRAALETPQVPAAAPESEDGSQRLVGYVLGGTGIAAGVAAVTLAVVSDDRFDDWQREHSALELRRSASDPETEQRRKDNDALLKSVWQMDALTWAFAIGSGALLAGSVAVLWTAPDSDGIAPSARFSLRGSGVELAGHF